ncbi:glycoside hydrolase family 18 protein [Paxillus rubicundulus Ve08.2h10]|uniref:Glycoside hydrolase family 18 protein n=1 Tax=Paxillus rubicundulus Ve08.2h10 TaxID=930991 RepID=A0A0D0CXK3_9AGAM|nr:glycoside hydrolase family 18 protein [Paxillus rubicundulus Ve08.2h10]
MCPPDDQVGSAVTAVKAWTAAGMPLNKIVLGVAAYGHSFCVSPSDAFVNGSKTEHTTSSTRQTSLSVTHGTTVLAPTFVVFTKGQVVTGPCRRWVLDFRG